jgi:hypothetical protein
MIRSFGRCLGLRDVKQGLSLIDKTGCRPANDFITSPPIGRSQIPSHRAEKISRQLLEYPIHALA